MTQNVGLEKHNIKTEAHDFLRQDKMKTACAANIPNCSVRTALLTFCFKVSYCLVFCLGKKKRTTKLKLKEQLISYVKGTLVEHLLDTLHLGESVLGPCLFVVFF